MMRLRYYEGRPYVWVVEPLLRGLHALVAAQVTAGQRVVDVGCGAGGLALRLAPQARTVLGVDRSTAMIAAAERRPARRRVANLRFVAGDAATVLAAEPRDAFDVATLVLMLHELPTAERTPVLQAAAQAARRVLCVDFRVPQPRNLAGLRNRTLEVLAGPAHFQAFRDYVRRGGVPGLAAVAGLSYRHVRRVDGGSVDLWWLERG